jgi:hypothetical protein
LTFSAHGLTRKANTRTAVIKRVAVRAMRDVESSPRALRAAGFEQLVPCMSSFAALDVRAR